MSAADMTPYEITEGEAWGCRYRVTRMLNEDGNPVKNLQVGQTAAGPGSVEGVAIIKTRDTKNERLEVVDVETKETFVVPFVDVWDIDRVYLSDEEE